MTGPELRAIRLSLGLTLDAFGRALGYEGVAVRKNISNMEAGRVPVPRRTGRLAERMRPTAVKPTARI
jgi:transcriptional regulator with XRE-family HTH domain